MNTDPHLFPYTSKIYRLGQSYYEQRLRPYSIGSGQYIFLSAIHQSPGISLTKLSEIGSYDNGTTARAIKKLESLEYVYREVDTVDGRVIHLYPTSSGAVLAKKVEEIREDWNKILTKDLTLQEQLLAESLFSKMAQSAETFRQKI